MDPSRVNLMSDDKAKSAPTMNEQSECSSVVCVVKTELYGSTMELDSWGAGYTQNSSLAFLP